MEKSKGLVTKYGNFLSAKEDILKAKKNWIILVMDAVYHQR